jgi:hypothetical protein
MRGHIGRLETTTIRGGTSSNHAWMRERVVRNNRGSSQLSHFVAREAMALVRVLLCYVVLVAAAAAALPAVLVIRPFAIALGTALIHSGFSSADSYQAASQLCSSSQGSVGWLILAAVLLANSALLRVWGAVARL